MNAHLGLIHGILPATVDLKVTVPENHPSARNLGTERSGSGTLVAADGHILTVHYITSGANSITVTLADGEKLPGKLIAEDFETGLALIKITARDMPFLRPAPPEEISLGQAAVMIASNGENGRRVSGGYVSSFASYDGHWEFMLEKTICVTAFNPGFGGGTLADFKGRMLGVVSLNLNEIGKYALAIPIENYTHIERELKTYGGVRSRPRRPWLGFHSQPFGGRLVVTGVFPNGPAAKSGLKEGDIILGVERKDIRSRPELYREMWKKNPGETIAFRILRDEESLLLEVVGGDRSDYYRS